MLTANSLVMLANRLEIELIHIIDTNSPCSSKQQTT